MAVVLGLASCVQSSNAMQDAGGAPTINRERARRIALDKYHELLADHLYWKDPLGGELRTFPRFAQDAPLSVELTGRVWLVQTDSHVGPQIKIRVASDGSWAALESLGFTLE